MARSPAQIQAEIAVTRGRIERDLDVIERRVFGRRWAPYAVLAGAVLLGVVLSRVPLFRIVRAGGRTVWTGGVTVASTLAAVDRLRARRRPAA